MRICDLTMAYSDASGGIRTYIDQKRRYLDEHTSHEHVLIVPGAEDDVQTDGRHTTRWIASPTAPGHDAYHIFWRPDQIKQALADASPDIIELGSFFVCPWPAFSYRRDRLEDGDRCIVGGYFHTDIAEAYVRTPVGDRISDALLPWSETLETMGVKLADLLGLGAEAYFGRIFQNCDTMLAATPGQIDRLSAYGVENPHLVPLGVDLDTFTPARRDEDVRQQLGAEEADLVLIFAGRLEQEKRVWTLVKAYEQLPGDLNARLVLIGEGPLGDELRDRAKTDERMRVLPYENERERFAALLASADVYVTAGPHETFGLSVIEAQACGLPVVGVEAGALTERIVEGVGMLSPVDDAEAMADRIQRAAANREQMGANARKHVEANYSWDATFSRWLGAYETTGVGLKA